MSEHISHLVVGIGDELVSSVDGNLILKDLLVVEHLCSKAEVENGSTEQSF